MGPKRGGFRRGTRQSSRVRGQNPPLEPENLLTPEPVQEPVEQSFVGGPSGPAPPMPTVMGDPNLQQTLELLTQALSRAGQSRDPSLGYADQAKRIGATDFDGDSDPAVAEEWIEKMERIMELEQGSMMALEYEQKFNELSKYCLPLVVDESKKCQLFIRGLKASIRDIVISQRLTNFGDLVMSASLIESSQMMVRARGEPRRRQYETGGPSQGSSKRGSYSSGSSSGRSFGGFRPGVSSSGGSNQSGSSGGRPTSSSVRGSGRQPPSAAGRMRSPQCGEATVAPSRETGTQSRTQFGGASSSGGVQTSVASRGGSQQQGRGRRARATSRVYHMSQQQAQASPDLVTSTLSVFGTPARILIDPGATHSFVTPSFAHNADVKLSALRSELAISVPTGEIFYVGTVYRDSPVLVRDVCLEAYLIPLEMVGLDVILGMEFAYNNSYQASIKMSLFDALYGKQCRTPFYWDEVGESRLDVTDDVERTKKQVKIIRERLKTAQDRQKSYADNRRKDLQFEVGDWVFLKLSPWKGVVRFGKRGKLSPRYIGPYEVVERVGPVAYRLALPLDLSRLHDVFHVSMLRKYIPDPSHVLEEQPIELKEDLTYVEQPVQILDRKMQVLRSREIPFVKVLWRSHTVEEATREPEDQMREQYPYLFE
ncbi:hypothetical protein L3X38_000650 [Prunus dulcis]|uniref:Tf2-1-like SH3-like domain-containing protein n=1 Tax=Prunus dulcis TaxID=3755 RepID=A0AAD4WQI8_PRUDU|nr:hypothetical protein L3X38_000650 [Prunus dulcis]